MKSVDAGESPNLRNDLKLQFVLITAVLIAEKLSRDNLFLPPSPSNDSTIRHWGFSELEIGA